MTRSADDRRGYRLLAWGLVLLGASASAMALERGEVVIDTEQRSHTLTVEIARSAGERAHGLMERDHLPADAGMLFLYDRQQPAEGRFWMYRTRIPLDIAFIGADGMIRALHTMPPCESERASECPSYAAGAPYRAALEVNAGYFEKREIGVGDRIALPE